ncbi:hypothetical protein AGMMS49938_06470 [Fibrobacterales bacterium]|nr:hypothetical protein AGMMS49938_06470 [Fibrobacterales bacterium]
MSLFESLGVATRGLAASQLAIDVAGQNITNASTEGYSRKRIEQAAEVRRDGSYGQMGFGVEVYTINRVRDQFLDRLVNEESTRYGYYNMKDTTYGRIEDIFTEPSDHALNTLLNNFWNGWSDVANNPADAGARETLRSTAQTLTGQFKYISTQLRSYKDTINDEIESRVNRINEITASIYRCNVVIAGAEGKIGDKANDTRDQRDKLVQELAQLVDVDYFEDEHGAITVTTNGNMLVSGAKNHELVMRRLELTEKDGYQYSRIEISFALSGSEFKPKQGELRALMDTRDIDIPKYEDYINEMAKSLITSVNEIHKSGYALSGLSFIDFFDADPSKANAYNISLSQAVKNDINNIAAGAGGKTGSVDKQDLQTFLDTTTPTKPKLLLQDVDDHYRHIGKGTLQIEGGNPPRTLKEGMDYYVDYQNAEITFNDASGEFAGNALNFSFEYNEQGYGGPGDGDNALLLSQLRDKAVMQSDVFGKSTQTINQFYSGMLGRLGVERNEAAAGLDTRTAALQQLKSRQQEVMGVNLDEEMASLIQYEHTYQASARYLTTVNTMLDVLLNM